MKTFKTETIEVAFGPGDKVWAIGEKECLNVCDLCEGIGSIVVKNKRKKCQQCDGAGKIKEFDYVVKSGKIKSVEAAIYGELKGKKFVCGDISVEYYAVIDGEDLWPGHDEMYGTEKEAQKALKGYRILSIRGE